MRLHPNAQTNLFNDNVVYYTMNYHRPIDHMITGLVDNQFYGDGQKRRSTTMVERHPIIDRPRAKPLIIMTATRHCSHHALSRTGFTRTPEFDRTQPDAMRLSTPLPALPALVGPTTTICTPNMPRHQKTTRCENTGRLR